MSGLFWNRRKKQFVLLDGSADGAAILVPTQRRGVALIEEVAGIEDVVLDELKPLAVEPVGATLQDDVENRQAVAVLRAEIAGFHLDFVNGLDGYDGVILGRQHGGKAAIHKAEQSGIRLDR